MLDGARLGTPHGAADGDCMKDADGRSDGCVLGTDDGTKLGKSDGDELGLFVGSRDGRILGSCVSVDIATQMFPTFSQLRHWSHCPLFRPAHVSHIIFSRQLLPCL